MILKGGGDFQPCPEGVHNAVCVDVVDLGVLETPWGSKHKLRIVWEVEAKMDDGRPFTVRRQFTASLHEKSELCKCLKSWRGRPFTKEELAGFDTEKIVGASAVLVVGHDEKDGNCWANVTAVSKATKKLEPSGKYVRVKDREENQPGNGQGGESELPGSEAGYESVPF
jgi:hypothetical protein